MVLFTCGHIMKMVSESMTYITGHARGKNIDIDIMYNIDKQVPCLVACSWATSDCDDFANKFSSGLL